MYYKAIKSHNNRFNDSKIITKGLLYYVNKAGDFLSDTGVDYSYKIYSDLFKSSSSMIPQSYYKLKKLFYVV